MLTDSLVDEVSAAALATIVRLVDRLTTNRGSSIPTTNLVVGAGLAEDPAALALGEHYQRLVRNFVRLHFRHQATASPQQQDNTHTAICKALQSLVGEWGGAPE